MKNQTETAQKQMFLFRIEKNRKKILQKKTDIQ